MPNSENLRRGGDSLACASSLRLVVLGAMMSESDPPVSWSLLRGSQLVLPQCAKKLTASIRSFQCPTSDSTSKGAAACILGLQQQLH